MYTCSYDNKCFSTLFFPFYLFFSLQQSLMTSSSFESGVLEQDWKHSCKVFCPRQTNRRFVLVHISNFSWATALTWVKRGMHWFGISGPIAMFKITVWRDSRCQCFFVVVYFVCVIFNPFLHAKQIHFHYKNSFFFKTFSPPLLHSAHILCINKCISISFFFILSFLFYSFFSFYFDCLL